MTNPVNEINTSGDLRRLLANTMLQITKGEISVEKALCLAALTEQINNSMTAEIRVAKARIEMENKAANLGKVTTMGRMLIGDGSDPLLPRDL